MHKPHSQPASPEPATPARSEPLRVGFVCIADPSDPTAISGMPYRTKTGLEQLGVDIVPLFPRTKEGPGGVSRSLMRHVPRAIRKSNTVRSIRSAVRRGIQQGKEHLRSSSAYDQVIERARRNSADISEQIAQLDRPLDMLFGICISSPLYAIETELPIVYCSDATARLILETYPARRNKPAGHKRACEELEQAALSRIDAGIFPTRCTFDSAVEHYGLPRERGHIVPLGSSITPDAHDTILADLPSRERLELIVVAFDPIRKRLDLCVEAAHILAQRGWNVTLHSIGGHTRAAAASNLVRIHGKLSMGDPIDRDIHKAMLRRSHFLLLPSLGEMFGIAPGEAAHFGRPSLVSAVGGLPTVVQHGKTGLCLPLDATPHMYADEIARLAEDPDTYRAMSDAALQRAQTVLNWPAFSQGVFDVLQQIAAK